MPCEDSHALVISEVIKCFNSFVLDTYSPNATGSVETLDDQTETESVVSFRRERPRHRESMEQHGEKKQIAALLRSAFFLLLFFFLNQLLALFHHPNDLKIVI